MDFPRDRQDPGECLFDDNVEAILLLFLHLSADLLVLVLTVGCLGEVGPQALDAIATEEIKLFCANLALWLELLVATILTFEG